MGKTLFFQQITDSRNLEIDKCLPVLEERINKIKELLNIDGIEIQVGKPYLLDFKKQMQYRANFRIRKRTRKITWNDIYKLVNSVKAVPYKFI